MKTYHWSLAGLLGLGLFAGCGGKDEDTPKSIDCQNLRLSDNVCTNEGTLVCIFSEIDYDCIKIRCRGGQWQGEESSASAVCPETCACVFTQPKAGGD